MTKADSLPRIGMIGVGLMGHGIAKNLILSHYTLSFLRHPGNQPVVDLIEMGAIEASDIATIVKDNDVVLLCVTGTPQVEEVLLGSSGVIHFLRMGQCVIDCSTAIPESTLRVAKAIADVGGVYMDAAMTRTPKEAEAGRLNLLVGASDGSFAKYKRVLEAYAEHITHVGPVGMGHQIKLLHNFVSLGFSAVLAEAAACAMRVGCDPKLFVRILRDGGGGGVVLERLAPYIETRDGANFRFSLANSAKDLGYYVSMADTLAAEHAIASSIFQCFKEAYHKRGQATVPELIEILSTS